MGVFGGTAVDIIGFLGGLYLLAILLRFLLQIARADFYNPVSQSIVKITDPMVRVFRRIIPGYRGIDFSCIVLAMVVEAVFICILSILYGRGIPSANFIILWSFVGVIFFIVRIYFYAVIASVIMSWIMMLSGNMNPHPILGLIWQLTEPVMAPIRKVLPPIGGMDLSPIFVIFGARLITDLLNVLFQVDNAARAFVIGI